MTSTTEQLAIHSTFEHNERNFWWKKWDETHAATCCPSCCLDWLWKSQSFALSICYRFILTFWLQMERYWLCGNFFTTDLEQPILLRMQQRCMPKSRWHQFVRQSPDGRHIIDLIRIFPLVLNRLCQLLQHVSRKGRNQMLLAYLWRLHPQSFLLPS